MDCSQQNLRRRDARAPSRRTTAGYSLHDLLVTSTIAGFLGVGAVSMSGMVQDARMISSVNELMGNLNLARSEAIKRNTIVALCKSNDSVSCSKQAAWNEGWIVFTDDNNSHDVDPGETVIRVQQPLQGNLKLRYGETGSYSYVRYNPSAEAWPGATFSFCDSRGAGKAKAVIVFWTGRPRVSTKTSDNKPLKCS